MAFNVITFNMDRLVIESILADVDEVVLSSTTAAVPSILLKFANGNKEQIKHAFKALETLKADKSFSLMICETLVTGMYDFEICTAALDEPVRICNKVLDHTELERIKETIKTNPEVILAVSGIEEDTTLQIEETKFKAHQVKS
jgi:hypothetical protein